MPLVLKKVVRPGKRLYMHCVIRSIAMYKNRTCYHIAYFQDFLPAAQ